MTNLEKSTTLIEAMNRVVLYSKLMQQHFNDDAEASWEEYKRVSGEGLRKLKRLYLT